MVSKRQIAKHIIMTPIVSGAVRQNSSFNILVKPNTRKNRLLLHFKTDVDLYINVHINIYKRT